MKNILIALINILRLDNIDFHRDRDRHLLPQQGVLHLFGVGENLHHKGGEFVRRLELQGGVAVAVCP